MLYHAPFVKDPVDGIEKVKLEDHSDNIKNEVLTHLSLDESNFVKILHPNEDEEMLSMYNDKFHTDALFRTKMSLYSYRKIK